MKRNFRSNQQSSNGVVKKAKKSSSPTTTHHVIAAESDCRREAKSSYCSNSYHHTIEKNRDGNHYHEESLVAIVGRMSAEFLDLYDDLDDWGPQKHGEPEEKKIDNKDDSIHEESSADTVGRMSDEDFYNDLDDSATKLSEDDWDSRRRGPDQVVDDEFLIDLHLYDYLENWRDDYLEGDMMNTKLDLISDSELSANKYDGGTEGNDDACEQVIYDDSDDWNLTIAQLKERLKKNRQRRFL